MIDISELNNLIIGRVEPHIYAFTTNTIPNYLKVGDTYRPVDVRLNEWREYFPDLQKQYKHSAKISDEAYFRDFAVHKFLEIDKGYTRLSPTEIAAGIYYSKEFFKDAKADDVKEAIEDIEKDYYDRTNKYQFYNPTSRLPETYTFPRTETYELRPNQKETVEAFHKARENGRKNLLMYAIMRFGKSFTAMCCALDMNAKLVVVVSGKADVEREWQKTVQSHVKFAEYEYLTSKKLAENNHIITETLATGKRVVVFLTLQDLNGNTIKNKHQEVFGQEIDLLLVDETHFGARADKLGAVLDTKNYQPDVKHKKENDDYVNTEEADEIIKKLKADTTIHLSGTPYRILMESEFKKEDIIAFCQFTDIIEAKEAWDKEHVLDDEHKEWDNPYYGFPQMIRFAFHPSESARRRLEELKQSGTTYAFSALFKPRSITKDTNGLHKQFVYEKEVLDLFEVIDGSKADDNLLSFLNYDKLKEGKMCRHIVIVLPYCAACDALEALIKNNSDKFRNLNDYEIINISGVDRPDAYEKPETIIKAIQTYEDEGKKTITLTVNRMLTGSTVPEWDTMIYLKDTASPQEYDQAIFRLQNQYIKTYIDENGDTIKVNMKPQTLLVDFDPNRMFVMQETKSQVYNVNVDDGGNAKLRQRIEEELRVSPIVTLNANKIVEVQAINIMDVVRNYRKDKGIREEALDVPADLSILDDPIIRAAIERENEIGSKAGLVTPAHEGMDDNDEGDDYDVPDTPEAATESDNTTTTPNNVPTTEDEQKKAENSWKKKIQSYYVRILLFAYLTKDSIISISDIIDKIETDDNKRIARNIGLSKQILTRLLTISNKFALRKLDYKIQNLSELSHATEMSPEERATTAMSQFGKLGDAIVITPANICDDMIALLPDDFMRETASKSGHILDIAGTAGEYAVAIYKKFVALGIGKEKIANMIYTIPKSSICYELIRKLYEMLGLNIQNIATQFVAKDLLKLEIDDDVDYEKIKSLLTQNKTFSTISLDDPISGGETDMITFDAVVGNPPYNVMDGGHGSSAVAIYDKFVLVAKNLQPNYYSIIMPSRWFSGGKGLDDFREQMINDKHVRVLHDFINASDCFDAVQIEGGICYLLWDRDNEGLCQIFRHKTENRVEVAERFLKESNSDIFIRDEQALQILKKVAITAETSFASLVLPRNPFGIFDIGDYETSPDHARYKLFGRFNGHRGYKFLNKDFRIKKNSELIDKYKVFVSKADGAAGQIGAPIPARIIGKAEVGAPFTICTETFLAIGPFASQQVANYVVKYMATKFFRLLVGIRKTKNMTRDTYSFAPKFNFNTERDNINWSKSITKIDEEAKAKYDRNINEIDAQLYEKYNLSPDEVHFIEDMIMPME